MNLDPRKRKLVRFCKKHRRGPSYRELANVIGLNSKSRAYEIAQAWRDEGFLGKDKAGHIVPGELLWRIPLLGTIDAGLPSNDALFGKSVALDDWLLSQERPTYMIQVKGDSMKDAHIVEGDYVMVEKTDKCSAGDIVVARVDNAWTIKYLREDGNGKRFLQSSNGGAVDIHPSHELLVVAVVTAVIRRYDKS